MIRYVVVGKNVKDREKNITIPPNVANRHYREYLNWLKGKDGEGNDLGIGINTPIPARPTKFYELVGDVWVLNEAKQWVTIREKRTQLLCQSDYTMLTDVSEYVQIAIAEWRLYRQKLRDIPQDFNHPEKVIWPRKPQEPHNGE